MATVTIRLGSRSLPLPLIFEPMEISMISQPSSRTLARHAPPPNTLDRNTIELVSANSQLHFYKSKCRVLEQDLIRLRELMGVSAPDNGALLPHTDMIRLSLIRASDITQTQTQTNQVEADQAHTGHDSPDDFRLELARLQTRIAQMNAIMNSPPVRFARMLSGWGRHFKRAIRRSRKPKT